MEIFLETRHVENRFTVYEILVMKSLQIVSYSDQMEMNAAGNRHVKPRFIFLLGISDLNTRLHYMHLDGYEHVT